MLISKWLEEYIHSHGIYDAVALGKNFEKETGFSPDGWPLHSTSETESAIVGRGLGGELDVSDPNKSVVWGYELASHLAHKYAKGFRSNMMGRGFIFRDCEAALIAAGH